MSRLCPSSSAKSISADSRLATASQEVVVSVVADLKAGKRPTVREIKNVVKGALVAKLEHPARRGRSELENRALFVEPNSRSSETWRVHPAIFPNGSRWEAVSRVLFKLGGREDWPEANELGPWLVKDVVPALEFAIGAKPSKGISTE